MLGKCGGAMCVSDSETGCTRRCACDSQSVRLLSDGVTHLSPRVLTQMPGGSGAVRLAGWCVAVTDCVSLPTRVCLGPKGPLGTLPGQAGRPRGYGGAGWAGSEVKRTESPSSPTQPHQADLQMEKNVHTRGRPGGRPAAGLLCAQKTSSSGISSSLAGSGFWVAGSWIQHISAPAEGQESSYLGLNRVTEEGP